MFWWGMIVGFLAGTNFGLMLFALLKMNKN